MPFRPERKHHPPGFKLRYVLEGHFEVVFQPAWSPDGTMLASGTKEHVVRIWNSKNGKLLRTIGGHSGSIYDLAWSPDGEMLASASMDKTVRIFSAKTGDLRWSFKKHNNYVNSVSWSPDGRRLVSASKDETIRLWDIKSGELIKSFRRHTGSVYSALWSPNGRMIASASSDNTVRLWDAHTGRLRKTLKDHFDSVLSVAWSLDSRRLASCSRDKTIRTWDPNSGKQITILEGHSKFVSCVSFSFDGKLLASKSADGTVRLWRCDTWDTVAILNESAQSYYVVCLAFHPRRPVLATLGDGDTIVRIWDLDINVLLSSHSVAYIGSDLTAANSILETKIASNEFDVFLCHNSEDKPAVKRIGQQLKKRGILPWLDEEQLRPGQPWQSALEDQIENIKSAAVLVGKNGIGAWQNLEQAAFLREFAKRGCPVIPVILPGCKRPPKLPLFLEGMMWVDFRKSTPDPIEQLIWGITGRKNKTT